MAKHNYGEVVGKCLTCTINLWSSANGDPVIWPCNINGCPYESEGEQHAHLNQPHGGEMSSGLGQIDF
jgi:hypothetical protein|tara:strand:+ start:1319 stop:1522 length:204 start_codon:yes stop_codon:yes gene_type:complete